MDVPLQHSSNLSDPILPPLKRRKIRHSDTPSAEPSTFRNDCRDHEREELGGVFTIRPRADSKEIGSVTLKPIALIPRARIPLSWLDPCSNAGRRIGSGRLFSADIPVLEKPLHTRKEPITLAARLSTSKSISSGVPAKSSSSSSISSEPASKEDLYVLERVTKGIYAACALGSWVETSDLHAAAAANASRRLPKRSISRPASIKSSPTSDSAPAINPKHGGHDAGDDLDKVLSESKPLRGGIAAKSPPRNGAGGTEHIATQPQSAGEGRNEIEQHIIVPGNGESLNSHALTSTTVTPAKNQSFTLVNDDAHSLHDIRNSDDILPIVNDGGKQKQPPPNEILENVRSQYLETLYVSKSSVAYFAKGTLSRTRAQFQQAGADADADADAGLDISELALYYRDRIIQIKRMDLKYRETLPTMIKNFALHDVEKVAADKGKKAKKKNSKNQGKIGRNGCYPDELDYVLKWWKDRDISADITTSNPAAQERFVKHLLSELRLRETQLQILLILEAIATERIATQGPSKSNTQARSHEKWGKPRKTQDLNVLLDLLVDRLCIWCTVTFDDVTSNTTPEGSSATSPGEDSKLRDFAQEVVIPFYHSRIPEQCNMIARKLGVLKHATPRRSTASKSTAVTPGTAVKRKKIREPARTSLHRVLTDEQALLRPRTRNFARSSSDLHDLERAQIDPLFSTSSSFRESFSKSERVDHREVDLQAVVKQHETRIKKISQLAEHKNQLIAAVDATKKTNRSNYGQSDSIDVSKKALRSSSETTSSSRKSKIPVRNPLGQGVQVMATPKRQGSKLSTSGSSLLGQSPLARLRGTAANQSPQPAIQASAIHMRFFPQKGSDPSNHSSFLESSIQETPSKQRTNPNSIKVAENEPATPMSKEVRFRIPALPDTTSSEGTGSNPPSTPQPIQNQYTIPESIQKPMSIIYPLTSSTPTINLTSSTSTAQQAPNQDIFETPRRLRAEPPPPLPLSPPKSTPLLPAKRNIDALSTLSVYQSLGWDEGSDDELAL
ncbi:hypothetical protein KEM54_006091 [Ascosphaera aggregata]|nr:hypothetical protein KEM54_006091 [Ascosphaera aggregata]